MRVAVAGATLFIAVFSLLSYRMYVGLDPLLGDQGQTQTTALSETFSEELKDLEEELFEEDEDEDDDSESSAATSSGSVTDQQSPATTTPQPTTRAS